MKTLLSLFVACLCAILSTTASAQLPVVTITATDATAAETLPGDPANPGNMRITRTGSTAGALTVWVKVSGVAAQGVDYVFGTGTIGASVVIPAGSATLDIPVNVIDDWLTEGTEDVRIKIDSKTATGGAVPYTVGAADRAIVNIADNEDPLAPPKAIVTISAVDEVATENAGGTDPAVFRITRTNNLTPALSVRYSLGGTATAGVDYAVPPATITIPAGVASVDVPIVPIDDTLIETPETVTFTLLPTDIVTVPAPAEAYVLGLATTASATIFSDDLPPAPILTVTAPGPNAAAASGTPVTVSFTASVADGYIMTYQISGGSGAFGYTNLPPETPPGTPFTGTATVTFTGSGGYQPLTVQVMASNGRYTASTPINVYVFTAPPPPPPPPNLPVINIHPLKAQGSEVPDGSPADPASFRVTHSFPASATVGFLFAMGGSAKEGRDYTLSSSAGAMAPGFFGRWFTFPAGSNEAVITVNPIHDFLIESTETVTMSLYTPPFIGFNEGVVGTFDWQAVFGFYYGTSPSATVSILDTDTTPPPFPLVTITATDPVATETLDGSDPAVFTVTRTTGPTDVPLTVNYALTIPPKLTIYVTELRPAMATNGADFPPLTGTVTIPAGATSADIVIVPTYDLLKEPTELLEITLRPSVPVWPAAGGYVIDDHITASVQIFDATLPAGTPTVWLRVTDAFALHEAWPGRTASFYVQRNANFTVPLDVHYTVGGTATNGVDYVLLPGVVTIPAGSLGATILVNPYSAYAGQIETVSITLDPPSSTIVPPPYVVGSTVEMPRSGGISIADHLNLSPKQRALILRRRHLVIPIPPRPPAPPALLAAPAAPTVPIWAVEASADLETWQQIGTTDPSGEDGDFVDVNAGNFGQHFYRFRPLP